MSATARVEEPPRGVNTGSPQDISEINRNMQAIMLAFKESQAQVATFQAQVAMILARDEKQASWPTARKQNPGTPGNSLVINSNRQVTTLRAQAVASQAQVASTPARATEQTSYTAGTRYYQTHTGTPLASPNPNQDFRRGRADHGVNSNTTPSGRPWNRPLDLEASPMSPYDMCSRLLPMCPEEEHERDDYFEYGGYHYLDSSPAPSTVQSESHTGRTPSTLLVPPLFCDDKLEYEEHDVEDWLFEHDQEAFQNLMQSCVEDIVKTLGPEWLQQTAAEIISNKAPRRVAQAGLCQQQATPSVSDVQDAPPALPQHTQAPQLLPTVPWPEDQDGKRAAEESVHDALPPLNQQATPVAGKVSPQSLALVPLRRPTVAEDLPYNPCNHSTIPGATQAHKMSAYKSGNPVRLCKVGRRRSSARGCKLSAVEGAVYPVTTLEAAPRQVFDPGGAQHIVPG